MCQVISANPLLLEPYAVLYLGKVALGYLSKFKVGSVCQLNLMSA